MSVAEELIPDVSFTGRNGEYDKTFIVEGHKIRVLKDVLCLVSPVFYAMLQRNFKEKDQAVVPLPGKKYQDFVEFLSCIYPNKMKQITGDSVYRILPLAFEYEVKKLEKRCQVFLVEVVKTEHLDDANEICRHINLTVEYELLKNLRKICISAASDFGLSEMEKAASKHQIPDNILVQIHHLARRKQELNQLDDDYLAENRDQSGGYLKVVERETDFLSRSYDNQDRIRAARLWYRYFQGEAELLENIVMEMYGMHFHYDDFKEEYELLPETIKQRLNAEFSEPESEPETEAESESEAETEAESESEAETESKSD